MEYKEAFEFYAAAAKMTDKFQKRDFLLHTGGEKLRVYKTFVFTPATIGEALNPTFDEVVAKFDTQFVPKRNVIFERHLFHQLWQKQDESVE